MKKASKNANELDLSLDSSPEQISSGKKRRKILPILLGITIVLASFIFGIVYLYQKSYYNDRWYENTTLNGVNVSGQTLAESKRLILQKMGDYALAVKARENGSMTIDGEAISFGFSFTDDIDKLFRTQHKKFSLFPKSQNYTTIFNVSYDSDKLRKILKRSELIKGSLTYPITKPKSATVKFSKESEQFECIKEIKGNKLVFHHFYTAVTEAVENAVTNLDITDEETYPNMYRSPKITSEDPELKRKQDTLNYSALRYIIWNMGKGVKEQITPKELAKWCTYRDGTVTFDETKISEWVESFCLRYKTTDKERTIKTHTGAFVTIQPGDYGWQIDYAQALEQVRTAIFKKIKKKVINAYLEDPSEENKKKLTFRKKVPYSTTTMAFKKDFVTDSDPTVEDWDPENYTEVSLSEQMIYVFRDGKVAFSCRCISGRPTPDRATKPGAYFIKEHQRARTLRGQGYATPVTNWVRITWSGTGFHSARWQRWSSWSPTYYLTRGSHGCLNLSTEDSESIYNLVQYKEAVFIY